MEIDRSIDHKERRGLAISAISEWYFHCICKTFQLMWPTTSSYLDCKPYGCDVSYIRSFISSVFNNVTLLFAHTYEIDVEWGKWLTLCQSGRGVTMWPGGGGGGGENGMRRTGNGANQVENYSLDIMTWLYHWFIFSSVSLSALSCSSCSLFSCAEYSVSSISATKEMCDNFRLPFETESRNCCLYDGRVDWKQYGGLLGHTYQKQIYSL